jgi:hypothetical protein
MQQNCSRQYSKFCLSVIFRTSALKKMIPEKNCVSPERIDTAFSAELHVASYGALEKASSEAWTPCWSADLTAVLIHPQSQREHQYRPCSCHNLTSRRLWQELRKPEKHRGYNKIQSNEDRIHSKAYSKSNYLIELLVLNYSIVDGDTSFAWCSKFAHLGPHIELNPMYGT